MYRVIIDRQITYELDATRQRTLPAGWRGEVTEDLATLIVSTQAGRLVEHTDVRTTDAAGAKGKKALEPGAKTKRQKAKAATVAGSGVSSGRAPAGEYAPDPPFTGG